MCCCFNLQGAKDWNCEYCIVCTNILSPLWTANLGQPEVPNPRRTIRILWWAPCLCTSLPDPSKNLSVAKGIWMDFWATHFVVSCLATEWPAWCILLLPAFEQILPGFRRKAFLASGFHHLRWREFCLTPFGVYTTAILISCNIIIYKLKVKCMFCIILPQMSFICRVWLWLESRPAVLNAEVRRSSGSQLFSHHSLHFLERILQTLTLLLPQDKVLIKFDDKSSTDAALKLQTPKM